MKVLFVGDEPSRLNTSPDVAFVGAKCWPVLCSWIERLDLDVEENCFFLNSNTDRLLSLIEKKFKDGFIIIALGQNAHKRLQGVKVKHHTMPHPSGLNRQLNDKNCVDKSIKECYEYIWGNFLAK